MSFTGPGRQTSITIVPQTSRGLLDAFRFDAILNVTESHPGQVFKHPVQLGIEGITDAVYLDAPSMQATGVVGDNPVELLAGVTAIDIAEARQIRRRQEARLFLQQQFLLQGLEVEAVPFGSDQPTNRAISLYEQLLALRAQRVPLTVLSSWRPPLANRWIETVDGTRDQNSGNTIGLSVTFTKMRLAVTQVVPSQIDSDVMLLAQQTIDISAVPTQN
jgi:hypothetical protein